MKTEQQAAAGPVTHCVWAPMVGCLRGSLGGCLWGYFCKPGKHLPELLGFKASYPSVSVLSAHPGEVSVQLSEIRTAVSLHLLGLLVLLSQIK